MSKIPNIVESVDAMFDDKAQRQGRAARSVHASSIGFPCARSLAYDQIVTSEPMDGDLLKVFDIGNVLEDQAIVHFTEALKGTDIDIIRDRMPMPANRYGIGGRVDWWVAFNDEENKRKKIPAEFKSMSPFTYDDLFAIEQFYNHPSPWIRKYPGQLLTYMFLSGNEDGMFIIRNKVNGRYRQINVHLNDEALAYTETLLGRAETVTASIVKWRAATTDADKENALPPRLPFDPKACEICSHFRRCIPDISKAPGVVMLCDIEVEAWCRIREQESEHVKAYTEADDKLKEHVAAMMNGFAVGEQRVFATESFFIQAKVGETSRYDVPKDIKEKYARKDRTVRKTIKRVGQNEPD